MTTMNAVVEERGHWSSYPYALKLKEDGKTRRGLLATTHPDRVGDILSKKALHQIKGFVNSDVAGGPNGSFRSISLYHDWVREGDPSKDEAGFLVKGTAEVVPLDGGKHFGVEADFVVNEHYHGSIPSTEINYRIDVGSIAGLSIEYQTDEKHSRPINHAGNEFRFIEELTEFGGVGFARPRMIANPAAVIYKEVEDAAMNATPQAPAEEKTMETKEDDVPAPEAEESPAPEVEEQVEEESTDSTDNVETKEVAKHAGELAVKEALESKELSSPEFKAEMAARLQVKTKVAKNNKEENTMTLSVKEMNEAMAKGDAFQYKEAASRYLNEHDAEIKAQFHSTGIPLNTTLQVKADGSNKLRIIGRFEVKDTLDTTTNTSSYTQNITEFADVYLPTIIDTFNNQTNLFGATRKVPHLEGSDKYGWRIKTTQKSSLSIDPDVSAVTKSPVNKLKLQTGIKEYRIGVSVTDFVLHHSRAAIGDLFMVEVESSMRDLMRDINNDLYTEQGLETQTKVLGLEYVADSAGNTTLYGLTRSTANRLAPATATDTYTAVGGALTEANIRLAMRKVEVEGALRSDLRIWTCPTQRDALFALMAARQYLVAPNPAGQLGFASLTPFGSIVYDGVPVCFDSSCPADALFVIDEQSYYIVISKAPQLVGLAKIGAAEEAFISVYLAAVYEQPRRIYQLDTLT